jgi:hypothetical protein
MSIRIPVRADVDTRSAFEDVTQEIARLKRELDELKQGTKVQSLAHDTLAGLTEGDDHTQYLDILRGDARYALISDAVTDHGALTGLVDNDHTQYLLATAVNPVVVKNVNPQTAGYGTGANRPTVAYTFAAGELAAQDAIHVYARLRSTTGTFKNIKVYYGGTSYVVGTGTNAHGADVIMDVRAIFALQSLTVARGTLMGYDNTDLKLNTSAAITVSDVSTNSLTVTVYGESGGASNDIVLDQVTIIHYKKVA